MVVLFALLAFAEDSKIVLARGQDVSPESDVLKRISTEAPKCWSDAEGFYRHLEGLAKSTTTDNKQGGADAARRFAFVVNDDRVALEVTGLKKGGQQVYCTNETLAFALSRPGSGTQYAIRNFGEISNSASQMYTRLIRFQLLEYLCLPYGIVRVRFRDLVDNPDWRLTVAASESNSSETVVVCSPIGEFAKTLHFSAIKIKVAPDRKWAVLRSELTLPGGRVAYSIRYNEPIGSVPILKTVTKQSSDLNGAVVSRVDFAVERLEEKVSPRERFTLPAYGLPDLPAPGALSETRIWLLLINAGVVLMVIGVLVRRSRWWRERRT